MFFPPARAMRLIIAGMPLCSTNPRAAACARVRCPGPARASIEAAAPRVYCAVTTVDTLEEDDELADKDEFPQFRPKLCEPAALTLTALEPLPESGPDHAPLAVQLPAFAVFQLITVLAPTLTTDGVLSNARLAAPFCRKESFAT
jgi:hypothetical protein